MKPRDQKRLQKFRENLVQLRKQKGVSQRGLSYQCVTSHAKISRLETDEDSNLNLTTLFELAKGFGSTPEGADRL
ncbi:MAG: helix-turn-helix transcriptional regulator [Bacteroidetes bacterium]|nr:helix-turn-helix transcriptional regulator [Bacteroidota bacterium]